MFIIGTQTIEPNIITCLVSSVQGNKADTQVKSWISESHIQVTSEWFITISSVTMLSRIESKKP